MTNTLYTIAPLIKVSERGKTPSPYQASDDPDRNVADDTKTAAGNYFSCQPSSDQANQQYDE